MFLGSSEIGGEFKTSVCYPSLRQSAHPTGSDEILTQDTSPSKNRWNTCSFDKIGWRAILFKNVCSMRFRLAIIAASSFAFACLTA